jgi:drug/metabolite transporter (DMT)-like permease
MRWSRAVSSPRPPIPPGPLLIAAAALIWGAWPLFVRAGGLSGAATSLVVLLVMALPTPFVFRRAYLADRGATLALAGVGLADAGNVALYFAALARGPVAVGVLTHYLAPLLVALGAPLLFAEPRRWRALAAAPLSLGGLALVMGPPGPGAPLTTAALGGGSALFYAAIVLCAKRAGRTYPPLAIAALHSPVSAVALLAVYGRAAVPAQLDSGVLVLAAGAVLCGLAASMLFYRGLTRVPAQIAGALTYLEPVAAAAWAAVALGEPLGPVAWVGAALVVTAGLWVALERTTAPAAGAAN